MHISIRSLSSVVDKETFIKFACQMYNWYLRGNSLKTVLPGHASSELSIDDLFLLLQNAPRIQYPLHVAVEFLHPREAHEILRLMCSDEKEKAEKLIISFANENALFSWEFKMELIERLTNVDILSAVKKLASKLYS